MCRRFAPKGAYKIFLAFRSINITRLAALRPAFPQLHDQIPQRGHSFHRLPALRSDSQAGTIQSRHAAR